MSALRVCHLGKYYPPASGGIETHVRVLALAQAELGADVMVFCANHEPGPTRVERDGPVEVRRFARLAALAKLDLCPELGRAIRGIDAEILHLHVPNPSMILGLLASRTSTPVVVTYHSDILRQKARAALFRPLERLAYRRVRSIYATSPGYAAGSSFLRPYLDRLEVLPHGLDLAPYLEPSEASRAQARAIRQADPGPIWVGCGRMVYYKGFANAVRALRDVPGTLFLIGGGDEEPALRALANSLGLADRVRFPGRLPHYLDLIPFYLAADAFWFPSNARTEAFGLVQVEAMACGVPVINTSIPDSGVDWVSRHDETGLTVPVDDPRALALAANRLLDEPGLRDRLGAAARARAILEFDHRLMAARSLELYGKVLARPSPRSTPDPAPLVAAR